MLFKMGEMALCAGPVELPLPVIDIAHPAAADAIRDACTEHGFFYGKGQARHWKIYRMFCYFNSLDPRKAGTHDSTDLALACFSAADSPCICHSLAWDRE